MKMTQRQFDLLIVAPQEFSEALQPLVGFKNRTSVRTEIITLEQIYANYAGVDEAEKIKWCLARFHLRYGVRYAMLVGDCDKFPVRFITTDRLDAKAKNTAFYAADLYYADLYNRNGFFEDWDKNKDGYFAELHGETIPGTMNVDEVEIWPDIAVGRVPASTQDEVATYAAKVIAYESAPRGSWFRRALLLAPSSENDMRNACKTLEIIGNSYLKNFSITRLYSSGNSCVPTELPTNERITRVLNDGVGFVCVIGHGSHGGWGNVYSTNDLAALNNSSTLPIIFVSACSTAAFASEPPYDPYVDVDGVKHTGTRYGEVFTARPSPPACIQTIYNKEGIGEQMMVRRLSGAIGYVGCFTGSQDYSWDLEKYFMESYNLGHRTLGGMWNFMLQRYYETHVPPAEISPTNWRKLAEFHQPWKFLLFGDPSLRIGGLPDAVQEDTVPFDPAKVAVKRIGLRWKVIAGDMWLLDCGFRRDYAERAVATIKHYNLDKQCFVGRPDASMEYYLVGSEAPAGAMPGEDAIHFNPAAITVKSVRNRWAIVERNVLLLDFGYSESEARTAFAIIQKYGFSYMCAIGRPNPVMVYFRR
jgi:hypothetical protein